MTNTDFPSGLRALRNVNGSAPTVRVMDCVTTVIYEGALAFMSNTGLVGLCSSSVVSSTLAKDIVGVFADSKAAGAVGAEGSMSKVRVYADPDQLYVIQSDDATTSSITTTIGRVFPILAANAGNSTTLQSTSELDGSAGASAACASATSGEILHCVAVQKGPAAAPLGASVSWARMVVKLAPKAHILRNNLGV